MAMQSPAQTRKLLSDNPALSYAVFQALAAMRLVDPQVVQSVLAQNPVPPPSAARPIPPGPAMQPGSAPSGPMSHGMMPPPHMPPGHMPPGHMPPPHMNPHASPPMGHMGYPPGPPPPGFAPPPPQGDPQRALIARILAMTPEEIGALPPQQRDQVLQVRAQFSGPHAR